MKKNIKLTVMISLFLTMGWVYGQANKIDFSLESQKVETSGIEMSIHSALIKTGDTIEWKQDNKGNASTTIFQISDISGQWNKNKSKGVLTYTLTIDGYEGVFVVEGADDSIKASITIHQEGVQQEQFTFNINSITYQ